MRGKQRKQMLDERYKVKYGQVLERLGTQRVLLPVSFGASSLVLLDMIASLLQEQNLAHKGKQGFELVVLHLDNNEKGKIRKDFESLEKRELSFSQKFEEIAGKYLPVVIKSRVVSIDEIDVDEYIQISVSNEFDVLKQSLSNNDPLHKLTISELLHFSPSKSLRADLQATIYEDLIFRTAISEGCQTVLFGHSMTRLATEVISLTVKGRGLSIHRAIADGPRQYGKHTVHVIFPLRDVLYAEVQAILKYSDKVREHVVEQSEETRIVKNMTVQALTSQYFENLDATGYSSTASTVVKTAEKLGGPKEAKVAECEVCGGDIHQDPHKWLRNITVADAAPLSTEEERSYAEKYDSDFLESSMAGDRMTVCYGCTVTLAGAGPGFVWPTRLTNEEILSEFVLDDEE